MWIEINEKNNMIVGIHSHVSSSPNKWVEYKEEYGPFPNPGDSFVQNRIVPLEIKMPIEEMEMNANSKASYDILQKYPLWKQLNILRTGTPEEIAEMGAYIDAIRAESNK